MQGGVGFNILVPDWTAIALTQSIQFHIPAPI
jgi:hypothetical protein